MELSEAAERGYQDSPEDSLVTTKEIADGSERIKERETWSGRLDFVMACIGGAVGLGNVWRFPYLCFKNGGGAFLIPYFLCLLLGSLPLFLLEVSLGQYMSAGGMKVWKILPIFQGIGLSSTVMIGLSNTYYNIVLAWTLMYIFHSFASTLPWDSCDGWWNTPQCSTNFSNSSLPNNSTASSLVDPVTEFWENKVLRLSSGIDSLGSVKWDLALCLLLAWILVYLCICKGIRSSGKVMYFTAPAPYVLMFILLARNATLPAADNGVKFYLDANLTKLTEVTVWIDAGKQTLYSSAVAMSIAPSLGSYNKFKHNCFRDSVIFAFVNALTSFIAGFLVFTILGFMAFQQGRPVSEVAESGPGLIFIAYPKAVAQMPLSQFWSVLFFLMILLLGLDSQFLGVEAVVTAITDQFPTILRRGFRKEIFVALLCISNFLFGLIYVTNGGMYVLQLLDFFSAGQVLILIGLLEPIAISYFYGLRRFRDNLEMMVGKKWTKWLFPYLGFCWSFATPVLCLTFFLLSFVDYKGLEYKRPNESVYTYPEWAFGIGWATTALVVIWIPLMVLYPFIKYGFSYDIWRRSLVPYSLKPHQMRPQDKTEKRLQDLDIVLKPGKDSYPLQKI